MSFECHFLCPHQGCAEIHFPNGTETELKKARKSAETKMEFRTLLVLKSHNFLVNSLTNFQLLLHWCDATRNIEIYEFKLCTLVCQSEMPIKTQAVMLHPSLLCAVQQYCKSDYTLFPILPSIPFLMFPLQKL